MGFVIKLSSIFFLLIFLTYAFAESSKMDQEQRTLASSVNSFSADFYTKTAAEIPDKNLIMSPLSAEIILALLSLGARGKTQEELNVVLRLTDDRFTKSAFKTAMENLNSVEGVTLNIANKVFVKEGERYVLNSDFKKYAVENFFSEAQNLNFNQSALAAKTINTWVEDKTNNKIKDLIQPDSLDDSTRLVLVNAIYFKGKWKDQFDTERTYKQDFFLTPDNTIQVDMMHKTAKYPFADVPEWDAKVLELPYEKEQMSMVIILPNEIDGLKKIEDKLASGADLSDVYSRLETVKVEVSLPKFKIETEIDLKKVLPNMGMKMIFNSNESDLGGLLDSNEPLVVSEAIQKAFIEVNEEGAEAAAATVIKMIKKRCAVFPESFTCDRSFLYYLQIKKMTQDVASPPSIVFIGVFRADRPEGSTLKHTEL